MSTLEILLVAISLAMDAFAVSVSVGATSFLISKRARFRISFHFGWFQFLMPIIGWLAGSTIEPYIKSIDHWIALALLAYVGIRMIRESREKERKDYSVDPSRGWSLVLLSIATSIDALAVGFSLAIFGMAIWYPAVLIGIVAASLSFIGVRLGNKIGERFGKQVEFFGGILLIGIGIKIVIEHLMR